MAIVFTDDGLEYLSGLMLVDEVPADLVFKARLFKNNYVPVRTSTPGDFTEATFASYVAVDLERDQWSAATIVGLYAQRIYGSVYLQWTPSAGSQQIYGWYATDDIASLVLWAELFPTPITATPTVPVAVLPLIRIRGE